MALTPTFQVGPPPSPGGMTKSGGKDVFVPNPQFYNWQRLFWQWSSTLGNNADGAASFSGSIAIGTSPNWFKADSSGIWLGGASFAASPFRVSMAGALTASNVSVTGGNINTSGYVFASGANAASGQILGTNVTASSYGQSNTAAASTYDTAVFGYNGSTSGTGSGHVGTAGVVASTAASAMGVFGYASAGQGVFGYSDASGGNGVRGRSTHASGYGVVAENTGGGVGLSVLGTMTIDNSTLVANLHAATADNLTATAWSSTTPTPTSESGAFTTVSSAFRYQQFGKLVNFSVVVTVTAQGTAGGYIKVALPVTAKNTVSQAFGGGEGVVYLCGAWGYVDANYMYIRAYNGGSLTATGCVIGISGVYEAA